MMNNNNSMPMTTLKRQNSTVEEEAEHLEADAMNILIGLNKSPPTSLDFVDCNKAAVAQPTMDSSSSSIDQSSSSNGSGGLQEDDANHHQIVVDDGQRSLRPRTRKPSARAAEAALMADSYTSLDIGTQPSRTRGRATSKDSSIVSTSSSSTAAAAIGGNSSSEAAEIAKKKKPMRPLTAYHIFFQLEREYIIQTTDVDNDDTKKTPSTSQDTNNNNTSTSTKYYHKNVPPKYRNILLSSDWYYGPGKRQKRKHRKSHGKIGFLELSKVISKQWSTLEINDIETKQFVNDIAKQELDEYKLDIMKWKEMYGDVLDNVDDKKKKGKKKAGGGGGSRKSSPKRKRAVKISDSGDNG